MQRKAWSGEKSYEPAGTGTVRKRDLLGVLIALYQTGRIKVARDLALAPVLNNELVNFKVKIDLRTAYDSYEAWRESVHDDLVLAVALACWYAEHELAKHDPLSAEEERRVSGILSGEINGWQEPRWGG